MNKQELEAVLLTYKEAAMKKHQAGFFSEAAVFEQKFYLAKSYLLDPQHVQACGIYQVIGYDEPFTVTYLHGRMAWGYFSGSDEEIAFPIARLTTKSS